VSWDHYDIIRVIETIREIVLWRSQSSAGPHGIAGFHDHGFVTMYKSLWQFFNNEGYFFHHPGK